MGKAASKVALDAVEPEERRCLFGEVQRTSPSAGNVANLAEKSGADKMSRNVECGPMRIIVSGIMANMGANGSWRGIYPKNAVGTTESNAPETSTGGDPEREARCLLRTVENGGAHRGHYQGAERCMGAGSHVQGVSGGDAWGVCHGEVGGRMTDRVGRVSVGIGSYRWHHPRVGTHDRSTVQCSPV